MGNVVIGRIDKIDEQRAETPFMKSSMKEPEGNETLFLSSQEFDEGRFAGKEVRLFIPSGLVDDCKDLSNVSVYFELELYPFYQKIKEEMVSDEKPRGVLRMRRTVSEKESEAVMLGDLYVLSSLVGEPSEAMVKRTKREVRPSHVILTVDFGRGTMGHLEYTFANEAERIEFEWSGIKRIIEFDSDEMTPLTPEGLTPLLLSYSVDAILSGAHPADEDLLQSLNKYRSLLNGGGLR
ncbi:hypothetical protein [Rossellomorea vietnamensis]|uniref:Uncharacterized protein n=1 Tax=Rossellomorea vietnamensis TaxID=218284 RepID=A0A0P6WFE5_9BACI|nr:hypothetical protein [Rossellomorea vietnamensis]KPL59219.1 hypothetical protein AM506_11855 [Rossellomorea vietnamensis]